MKRRAALQTLATILVGVIGKSADRPLVTPEQERHKLAPDPAQGRLQFGEIEKTGLVLYLDGLKFIRVHYKGKAVDVDKDELMAALSMPEVG